MLTAKEYLRQYQMAEDKLEQRQRELDEFRRNFLWATGINLSERVQTSPKDKMSEIVAEAVDLEREIAEETVRLAALQHKILGEIQSLKKAHFMKILYWIYIKGESLRQVSRRLHYSYDRVRHLHGAALQYFYDEIMKVDTQ